MVKTKPCPISGRECNVTVRRVVVLLHVVLGVQETLTNLLQEDVALRELLVQRRDAGDAGLVRCHGRRWTTVDDLKRSSPQRRLVRRVVAELGPGQPLEPAARAVSCQATKIDPKDPISATDRKSVV